MQTETIYTGIDISKKFFDVAISDGEGYKYFKFSNDPEGFDALLKVLPDASQVVMEASGPYYLRLACYVVTKGIGVSVINPLIIRRFCQMRMSRAKTDKKDACMIAEYGKSERPPLWSVPEGHLIDLQQMESFLLVLNKECTALHNQLLSFMDSGMLHEELKTILSAELEHRRQLSVNIVAAMQKIATAHYGQMMESIATIPGLGKKTALMLVVLSGGFSRFEHSSQLSAYIGLSPRLWDSGTIKGKVRICKMGMSRIRAALYVCAWSAKRCNKACKDLYDRLIAKGKNKRLALIAVANKLLKQAFAIAKKQTIYQENYSKNICF
jgi:transposase